MNIVLNFFQLFVYKYTKFSTYTNSTFPLNKNDFRKFPSHNIIFLCDNFNYPDFRIFRFHQKLFIKKNWRLTLYSSLLPKSTLYNLIMGTLLQRTLHSGNLVENNV